MIRLTIFFLILVFSCDFTGPSEINFISDSDLIEMQEIDYIIIDVRTSDEFSSGYIKNAINLDFYFLKFNLSSTFL